MSRLTRVSVFALLLVTLFATASSMAAADPIDDAIKQAKEDGKLVLVDFWANWCGWCIKLDQSLEDPRVKALIDREYIYVKLDCSNGEYKERQNQVGLEGFPMLAVVSADYKLLGKHCGYLDADGCLKFLSKYVD